MKGLGDFEGMEGERRTIYVFIYTLFLLALDGVTVAEVTYDLEFRLRNNTEGSSDPQIGHTGTYGTSDNARLWSQTLPSAKQTGKHQVNYTHDSKSNSPKYDITLLSVLNKTGSNSFSTPLGPLTSFPYGIVTAPQATQCNDSLTFGADDRNHSMIYCADFNASAYSENLSYKHPALGVLLTFFVMVTIFGNSLVIVAVARERYLRTVTNYFIVSLALADLIIGAVVMPFSISMEMTNNFWMFGGDWCDVWHSFDVLASTASILNLSMISLDRYWAITDPIAYPSKMSVGRALILIALVWISSAAISFPAILWWRSVVTHPPIPDSCSFTEDTGYLIFSSIVSFYFPVSIILFAYYRIYKAASEQTRSLKTGSKVMVSDGFNGEAMTLRIHRGGANRDRTEDVHYARACANSDSDNDISPTHTYPRPPAFGEGRPSRVISRKWKHFTISRKLTKLAKEQKAAKTLGIVMGVFCICWVPFFVSNVLFGVCNIECVYNAEILFPVFTWLGYINSGMNPVIYAYSMRDFRRAFIKTLCCCCPGYHKFRARRTLYERSFSTSSFAVSACGGERSHNVRL